MNEHDKAYMDLAIMASNESPDPYMKVGAVGVCDNRNGIVSFGYNDIPNHDKNHPVWKDRDARRPLVVHAETMMCSMKLPGQIDTVYITLFPCVHCMTQLAQAEVKKIVYKDIYDKDLKALEVAAFYNIKCVKYEEVTPAE